MDEEKGQRNAMTMRHAIYNTLVNKHIGISQRYHAMHDGAVGLRKILSWLYLLWLNFAYYILFCRFLGRAPQIEIYEEKRLNLTSSESESCQSQLQELVRAHAGNHNNQDNSSAALVESYVKALSAYDVISFDIFDTLIFRPFSDPTDLFYIVGEELKIMNFKSLRVMAEHEARKICIEKNGHSEIILSDIWDRLLFEIGRQAEGGMEIEIAMELALCYANPLMLAVWQKLLSLGKEIIVVSDMYLPSKVLSRLLEKNGFTGYSDLYVSCEYAGNKASGSLYDIVRDEWSTQRIVHVGDNPISDVKMAKKHGFAVCPYANVNHNMQLYRPYDMSYLIGSAYRGIVSNRLYCGLQAYSMEYEYGYLYGGLFVQGYCHFIHEYCRMNGVDRILFFSRDGDILKQVYERTYPKESENTRYVYMSRKAATILMADEDRHDYCRRFIDHKVNQGYTISKILNSMQLEFLEEFVDDPGKLLTSENAPALRKLILTHWDEVYKAYEPQLTAAKRYYSDVLAGSKHAVAVDIGWAGSGAIALSNLVERVWKLPCTITGIIAGTNTPHNAEPDASETFLQSGKLVAYLYSQRHNRDLLKKHNPNKDYNVFWELLLSSPTPQFQGFYLGQADENDNRQSGTQIGAPQYLPKLDISLVFGKYDANQAGIKEVQRGILDFAQDYLEHFGDPVDGDYSYMYNISGRDAYAPMLVAASFGEKYLKEIEKRFGLEVNVE